MKKLYLLFFVSILLSNVNSLALLDLNPTEGLTNAAKEMIWYKQMLKELNRTCQENVIFCDNKSTICLAKNPEYHARSKHIDIRHHFIREKIETGEIKIEFKASETMSADILTKGLPKIKHYKCMELMNIKN